MVLGQPTGYIKLWSSLAKPWRRLWGELSYLGAQDFLPSNPKWTGPTISSGWDTSCWNCDASAAAEDYTNAQAASDAGTPPVVRLALGSNYCHIYFDWQEAYVTDNNGNVLQPLPSVRTANPGLTRRWF